MHYWMLLWPGFARAWWRGEIYGVVLTILFAVCFNLAWTATFLWSQWLSGPVVVLLWTSIVVSSIGSLAINLMRWQTLFGETRNATSRQQADEAFRAAQRAYLRGEYFEAEATLHPIFASGREDADAALLLASILRRTNRIDQSLQTLDRLSRLDHAAKWAIEIQRERFLCQQPSSVSDPNATQPNAA